VLESAARAAPDGVAKASASAAIDRFPSVIPEFASHFSGLRG
jgi:hypothetical protein